MQVMRKGKWWKALRFSTLRCPFARAYRVKT